MPTATRTKPQPVQVTVTDGDMAMLSRSFRRSLEAANLSPATVRIYTISVAQLADFLQARGMPLFVANLTREHLEEWLLDILARRRPAQPRHATAGLSTEFRKYRARYQAALASVSGSG